MSKIKDTVMVGVANEGELSFDIEVVKTWEPTKITYMGGSTYFSHDSSFYSIERSKFKEIFGTKYLK